MEEEKGGPTGCGEVRKASPRRSDLKNRKEPAPQRRGRNLPA